ncbi:RidA family protein [Pseudomonas cichorii]|uniref:RidA family protein n=1 Tax=Pseudomonas cichorii TaxID=36746 RepID=UPI001C895D0F|nr:RidA family protein [Pseudomonas cichorii]MBX8483462.1 RidA family protein [Pseudomonas cichorii]MBX8493419.1 RidA family protein [Pseudomonas cichorii]MBX8513697.1 RidA family protein [Pseudomonas cichorii]MBX8530064.1 RidA family protein [Pseudomonas cichorii]MBX8573921.1 RidA family protein [Pseudomonas cichorii]
MRSVLAISLLAALLTGCASQADRTIITSDKAPPAIGPYSQAVKTGNTVYMSGQLPMDPKSLELVEGIEAQTVQVFENLKSVAEAAGGSFKDTVKLSIFLTDLNNFAKVNEIMGKYFEQPYPARVTIGVASLPRGAQIEIDAILVIK